MIGKTIAHYKILEKIGEGGMGVVYKAEDTKLKRTVALKFLPAELTRDAQAKARFVQEAQAAAALDHPNICAVYEIGEAEGSTYIAMPYIKGQSLKERIAVGPLSVEETLSIAGQIAEGLKEAHERGIIHRDIKPANIMLTEKGQAKIMDFGLAKLEKGVDLTRTMALIGTAAYMSPEQARGEEVDLRTDIWSFGATLYEMLTGSAPFGRKQGEAAVCSVLPDMPALLHSISYDPIEPPSRLRKDMPRPAEQIILRALDKDRNRRYQNMAEVLKDLRLAGSPVVGAPKAEKSIIVLPFENISPDPEQEYFCDGMTEEIITDLSHIHELLVISRSSAMTFKGTKKTIPEIAGAVNVRYVLEGSVRKAGNNLRITAQLIDAETDAHLWAERYVGSLDNVFEIQEKVSRAIANALKLRLSPEDAKRMYEKPIANVTAYESYLKAYHEILGFSEASLNRAIQHLQDALDIVGDNALLYSTMAYVYWQYVNIGIEQEEYIAKAEELVKKALSLDPESPQSHTVLGAILVAFRGNQRDGIRHLKKAVSFGPDDPMASLQLAVAYIQTVGKLSAADSIVQKILRIDPLNSIGHLCEGAKFLYEGKYESALEAGRRAYQIDPENPLTQFLYSWFLAHNNRVEEALLRIDQIAQGSADVGVKNGLLLKWALLKDKEKVFQIMTPDFHKTCRRDPEWSYYVGGMLSLLGAREEALDWLENAANQGFINYPALSNDTFLANIRGEPRFQKLMERVKYEWENFEV